MAVLASGNLANPRRLRGSRVAVRGGVRSAILVLLVITGVAHAERKPGWVGVGFAFGGPPAIKGDLRDRMDEGDCGHGSCELTATVQLGGGYKRWGIELIIGGHPMADSFSTDYRDRDRHTFLWGPMVRYALVQKWGFDVSIRAGLQHGSAHGNEVEERGVGCDGPCPTTTYEPPVYSMWGLTTGATLGARVPVQGGYLGVFADLDYTLVRVSYPDTSITGRLVTRTYGIAFGSRFP